MAKAKKVVKKVGKKMPAFLMKGTKMGTKKMGAAFGK